jgi:hypothetical protein
MAAQQVTAMMLLNEFVDGLSHLCRQNQVGNPSFGLSLMKYCGGSNAAGERRDVGARS